MIKVKKGKLKVDSDGSRHSISVPEGRGESLHAYLRDNHVHSAPPQPYFRGFDSIELAKGTDLEGVQVLLNAWS